MYKDVIEANAINLSAIGISLADLNGILTAFVLATAIVYNIKKISNEDKTNKTL